MTDRLTSEQRSKNMSRIRGKNTGPEFLLRKILRENGYFGYRIHYNISGKPDVVFINKKIAIFVDGCFWHKCPIHFKTPETRKEFWLKKINRNVERDGIINQELEKLGWVVIRVWEHELKDPKKVVERISQYHKV